MDAYKQHGYGASERCPVCGSRPSGYAAAHTGPGVKFPALRAYYRCGYTVTAAGTSSGGVLVVGIGCRGSKTVHK